MTTLSDIEKLAQKTAREALKEDTPIQTRIDALKSLTPYYTALKKAADGAGGVLGTIRDTELRLERAEAPTRAPSGRAPPARGARARGTPESAGSV